MGQLKYLRNKLSIWANFVTEWALDNWAQFSEQAKLDAGTESAPPTPHIGFLLAHPATAVNLMQSTAQTLNAISVKEKYFKRQVQNMVDGFQQQILLQATKAEEDAA
jgi:hypothetical protein